MGRKKKEEGEEEKKLALGSPERPAVTMGEASKENPSGIEKVDPEHAQHIGELRGDGGPGAAGATVLGGVGFAATEGGSRALPTKENPEPESDGKPKTEGAAENENIGNAEGAASPTETGEEDKTEGAQGHNVDLDQE